MFKLELYDRSGNKLKPGDTVKISNGKEFSFYAEVKYLEEEKVITPFHTFSFHSFEKVDCVPDHAVKLSEERYNVWFTHSPEIDEKEAVEHANKYLIDWRKCEHLLEKKCFRIEPIDSEATISDDLFCKCRFAMIRRDQKTQRAYCFTCKKEIEGLEDVPSNTLEESLSDDPLERVGGHNDKKKCMSCEKEVDYSSGFFTCEDCSS